MGHVSMETARVGRAYYCLARRHFTRCLCLLFPIYFSWPSQNQYAHSQELRSTEGAGLWSETDHPVVHSLAELRRMQREVGQLSFEVDLQAQLTFAARYWNVFFIQDGDVPAMVKCTDAASAILNTQPMGKCLRIRGLVYQGQPTITLVGFELLQDVVPIQPLRLERVPKQDELPLDRVVELPCRLLEVLDKFNTTFLFAEVNKEVIELHVESSLSAEQYAAVEAQAEAIAVGTLSPKHEWVYIANSAIRMLRPEQLRLANNASLKVSGAPRASIQGQVLYTDNMGLVVISGSEEPWRISTRFAEHLTPGLDVIVWGNVLAPFKSHQLESQRIRTAGEGTLPVPVALSVGAWEQVRRLPGRVTLEAVVESQSVENGLRHYRMRSANKHFTALVNEESGPRGTVRAGDRIRLTGTPLIDATRAKQSADRLKLYVINPDGVQFVSAPLQLSMAQYAWAISFGSILVAAVFSWNWLLHRKVNARTKGLKKLSSHLKMSFDAINEALLVTDAHRRLSTWNRQFERLFGECPAENQSIDAPLNVIRKRLQDPSVFTPILRAGETQSTEPVSVTLTLENPTQVVRAFVAGIIDNEGTYHGHLYTFDDVTETQRLENELIQSQKMEAIGQLSGGVAHDFNNLLTIVSSNLALIKFTDSPAAIEFVNAAESAVRRAAELTQQLLDFSRRSKLEIQVVNLNELVGRIGTLLRRTIDRSVSLQIELCSTPLMACIDINRIEQVLINICINARDAMKGRNGKITVRVSPLGDNGSEQPFARVEIEDNGCGMSREVQSRIFDPFFTTKKPGEGTGLGLSMAQGVVEQLGGRIYCYSKPDVGTRFRIELPLTEQSDSKSTVPPAVTTDSGRSLRVLLVDDELMVRTAGQALLRGLGHLPDVASSGQEALAKLETDSFDVVLLDLTMPTMSGRDAYETIHQRWPELPVAICTGYHVDLQTWNTECSFAPPKIIAKPYSVESLTSFLHSLA